jgi:hypothetical protein
METAQFNEIWLVPAAAVKPAGAAGTEETGVVALAGGVELALSPPPLIADTTY